MVVSLLIIAFARGITLFGIRLLAFLQSIFECTCIVLSRKRSSLKVEQCIVYIQLGPKKITLMTVYNQRKSNLSLEIPHKFNF